jgi:2-polyprenyl-3-methyl-5-hydroxy-6-metoxy-1,4-benzoquinol methylase
VQDEELTAAIREVRERARARTPEGPLGLDGVSTADLMPLVHARDAAEAKVAAIGTVNPRPPGLKNSIAQGVKRWVARVLDWHVREQVEFNRAAMGCIQASLEALTELSRGVAALAAHHRQLRDQLGEYHREAEELKDIRRHWTEWRAGFEERRSASEIHMLRTISELQAAFQHRLTLLEQNYSQRAASLEQSYRDLAAKQHGEFQTALDRTTIDLQKRLWQDLQNVQSEYEKLIYTELRLLRQKQQAAREQAATDLSVPGRAAAPAPSGQADIPIDWMRFAGAFRGSEERIREHQKLYVARFVDATGEILDIGCGRGEFLEAAREAGLAARGIDQSEECVALCRTRGLNAERADLFTYLENLPDRALGGVYCSQVVEHLPPERIPVLVRLMSEKLRPGALAAIETPNPECLAIFATHFYLDPTHTRPVPPALLRFYMEESGFGNIVVERLSPAIDSVPALNELPPAFRDAFFGGLDYAIFARKL